MDMIQVFKIVHNIDDISMNRLFEFSDTQTRGNSKKLKKPGALKTFRMNSFCVRTINKWNSLPDDIVNSKTVLSFITIGASDFFQDWWAKVIDPWGKKWWAIF